MGTYGEGVYRFLLSRRWLGLFAFLVVFALLCGLLARWQWQRRDERLSTNHRIESNYHRDPVTLGSLLPVGQPYSESVTWRPVELTGRYLTEATLLLRNRPYDYDNSSFYSATGYDVLVPFQLGPEAGPDAGRVLLVDRGWVETGPDGGRPRSVPQPAPGESRIVVRLQPEERRDATPTADGQVYWIRPAQLTGLLGERSPAITEQNLVPDAYGQLVGEQPAATTTPRPFPEPLLDEGPHLSYSVQWVLFAVLAFGGFFVLARRTKEDEELERATARARADGTDPAPRPRDRARPQRAGRVSDEDAEDAALDDLERLEKNWQ